MLISNQVIDVGEFTTSGADGDTIAIQALDTYHKDLKMSSGSQRRGMADSARKQGELSTDDYAMYFSGYNLFRESDEYHNLIPKDSKFSELFEDAIIVPSEYADAVIFNLLEDSTDYFNKRYQMARPNAKYDPKAYQKLINKYEGKELTEEDFDQFTNNFDLAMLKTIDGTDTANGYWNARGHENQIQKEITALDDEINETKLFIDLRQKRSTKETQLQDNKVFNELLSSGIHSRKDQLKEALVKARKLEVEMKKKQNELENAKTDTEIKLAAAQRAVFRKMQEDINIDSDKVSPELEKAVTLLVSRRISGQDFVDYLIDVLTINVTPREQNDLIRRYPSLAIKTEDELKISKNQALAAHNAAMKQFNARYNLSDLDKMGLGAKIRKHSKKYKRAYSNFLKNRQYSNNAKALAIYIDNYGKQKPEDVKRKEKPEDHIASVLNNFSSVYQSILNSKKGKLFVRTINEETEYDIINEEIKRVDAELENMLMDISEAPTYRSKLMPKKSTRGMLDVPAYGTRSQMAYGTAEINRRDDKDRRFHQPLMIKVQFRERLGDGTFSDNELTAVIGILGRIIRVPSDEMKYILKANYEKDTVRQLTTSLASGKFVINSLASIFNNKQIQSDIKNLPQTHELWENF